MLALFHNIISCEPAEQSVPMLIEDMQCKDGAQHILRCNYGEVPQHTVPDHRNDFAISCGKLFSIQPSQTNISTLIQ